VAVKEIIWPPQLGEGEQGKLCQRPLREARTAIRLNHPGVIRVYDVAEDDGCPGRSRFPHSACCRRAGEL
jgi:hypothetical protein